MAKTCKYTVHYGSEIAKFSDRSDAMTFARMAGYSEVSDKTGLIGQFVEGKATPEFAHLDKNPQEIIDQFVLKEMAERVKLPIGRITFNSPLKKKD